MGAPSTNQRAASFSRLQAAVHTELALGVDPRDVGALLMGLSILTTVAVEDHPRAARDVAYDLEDLARRVNERFLR